MNDDLDIYDEPEFHRRTYGIDPNTGFSDDPDPHGECKVYGRCWERAEEECRLCQRYTCNAHLVSCATGTACSARELCLECAVERCGFVLVNQKWACEECVPEPVALMEVCE